MCVSEDVKEDPDYRDALEIKEGNEEVYKEMCAYILLGVFHLDQEVSNNSSSDRRKARSGARYFGKRSFQEKLRC